MTFRASRMNIALMAAAIAQPRPVEMYPVFGDLPPMKPGCQGAACRTLDKCLCDCKKCKTWCREVTVPSEET